MSELLLSIEQGTVTGLIIALMVAMLVFAWMISRRGANMSNGNSVEVARMEIRRSDWDAMEPNERAFVFGIGHIANEIMALRKLVAWTHYNGDPGTPESIGCHVQMRMVQRLLAGKLFEANEFLRKAFFSTRMAADYENALKTMTLGHVTLESSLRKASDALQEIKRYFNNWTVLSSQLF